MIHLPMEILFLIFSFVEFDHLYHLELVCKLFYRIINDQYFISQPHKDNKFQHTKIINDWLYKKNLFKFTNQFEKSIKTIYNSETLPILYLYTCFFQNKIYLFNIMYRVGIPSKQIACYNYDLLEQCFDDTDVLHLHTTFGGALYQDHAIITSTNTYKLLHQPHNHHIDYSYPYICYVINRIIYIINVNTNVSIQLDSQLTYIVRIKIINNTIVVFTSNDNYSLHFYDIILLRRIKIINWINTDTIMDHWTCTHCDFDFDYKHNLILFSFRALNNTSEIRLYKFN